MRQLIRSVLRQLAAPAFQNETRAVNALSAFYQQMVSGPLPDRNDRSCEGIVFSKDRALQLHALLSSYHEQVSNSVKLTVLYTTSSPAHAHSYEELSRLLAGENIRFIRETSFKTDLEKLLDAATSNRLFFMTDDGIFTHPFNLDDILQADYFEYVPSVIKGMDLTYCYIHNRQQSLPRFINDTAALPSKLKCWKWNEGEKHSDWAYPLSLDATFYYTKEIRAMIRQLDYQGPNSLESALHHTFSPVFLQRKGICYEQSNYVNVVCNVVNTEHANRHTGLHTAEQLLQKWQQGFRIRYENFYGKSCGEAEQSSFEFVPRQSPGQSLS